eukprot:TRINITY_DN64252_c0_g1_i8.p1 TRINITY_DN64252_c0_g1~~TRINITY_DN64252_c0_g1_i8.p1  ORF type:complete len:497 (+),score=55.24 TRINITY_DN64252_c0_g1_i8:245-1735(+)
MLFVSLELPKLQSQIQLVPEREEWNDSEYPEEPVGENFWELPVLNRLTQEVENSFVPEGEQRVTRSIIPNNIPITLEELQFSRGGTLTPNSNPTPNQNTFQNTLNPPIEEATSTLFGYAQQKEDVDDPTPNPIPSTLMTLGTNQPPKNTIDYYYLQTQVNESDDEISTPVGELDRLNTIQEEQQNYYFVSKPDITEPVPNPELFESAMGSFQDILTIPDSIKPSPSSYEPLVNQQDSQKERVKIEFTANVLIERGEFQDEFINSNGDSCKSYLTNGPSQLAISEGVQVQAPNGDYYLESVTTKQCAAACETMAQRCGQDCCDSFAYNQQRTSCYLKKGGSRFQSARNSSGWQTFWRSSNNRDEESTSIFALSVCESDLQVSQYSSAYISRGYKRLAIYEGKKLKMRDGSDYKLGIPLQSCALECEQLIECDSFSYNLDRKECYLKSQGGRFQTRISSDGWSTYWRTDSSVAKVNCSKGGWFCLYCGGSYGNSCRNY